MSRLGFHYYPDDQHYTQRDLEHWLPLLRAMGAGSIVLTASAQRSIPEPFVTGMLDGGIEPMVRIPVPVGSIAARDAEPLLRSYGRWGVRHVVITDKPNLRSAWAQGSDWGRPGLVERFLDRAIPIWEAQRAAGLVPMFPALEPGGDYWDTAFLEAALRGLGARGLDSLRDEMALAVYAWAYGRPLDWGAGGPDRWPEARPYRTPEGCQDQLGFRSFEWYHAAAARAGAPSLPMLAMGGALPGEEKSDPSGDIHAERNLSIARLLATAEIPAYVQSFAFFLLAAAPDHALAGAAWFAPDSSPRPVVTALRQIAASFEKPPKSVTPRSIRHYLLLDPASVRWETLADYVAAFRPTVGFSPEEARSAEQVSLVGDSFSSELEARLVRAGCAVQRLSWSSIARRPAPKVSLSHPHNVASMLAGVIHG